MVIGLQYFGSGESGCRVENNSSFTRLFKLLWILSSFEKENCAAPAQIWPQYSILDLIVSHTYIQKETVEIFGIHNEEKDLEKLTLKGHIEEKRGNGKQFVAYLTSLCKRMTEQELGLIIRRQILLRATKGRRLWRSMITLIKEGKFAKEQECRECDPEYITRLLCPCAKP